jgi:hypothetical protein
MADIFVSYASADRELVRPIVALLEGEGWSVWWDTRIAGGDRWDGTIKREIEAARCVVVVWTPRSSDREWVLDEAEEGRNRGILVPIMIGVESPPLGFRRIQARDLTGWDATLRTAGVVQFLTDVKETLEGQRLDKRNEASTGPSREEIFASLQAAIKAEDLPRRLTGIRRGALLILARLFFSSLALLVAILATGAVVGRDPKDKWGGWLGLVPFLVMAGVFLVIAAVGQVIERKWDPRARELAAIRGRSSTRARVHPHPSIGRVALRIFMRLILFLLALVVAVLLLAVSISLVPENQTDGWTSTFRCLSWLWGSWRSRPSGG